MPKADLMMYSNNKYHTMGEKRKKDLCPEFPGIWVENEVCAIIGIGFTPTALALNMVALMEKSTGEQYAYLSDRKAEENERMIGPDAPYIHFKEVKGLIGAADTWDAEIWADYIEHDHGPVAIDAKMDMKSAVIIGEELSKASKHEVPGHPLVVLDAGDKNIRTLLKALRVERVTRIRSVEAANTYLVTANDDTIDAQIYPVKMTLGEDKNSLAIRRINHEGE